jgi:hypothetical protein
MPTVHVGLAGGGREAGGEDGGEPLPFCLWCSFLVFGLALCQPEQTERPTKQPYHGTTT